MIDYQRVVKLGTRYYFMAIHHRSLWLEVDEIGWNMLEPISLHWTSEALGF